MEEILITDACIKCRRCVAACPAGILLQDKSTKEIKAEKLNRCIVCGQCAAICPTGALHHSAFPKGTVKPFDAADCPTPGQMSLLIKKRRSNRMFKKEPVADDLLAEIVEAAHYAPTAKNTRDMQCTVVDTEEGLRSLVGFTLSYYEHTLKILTNPVLKPLLRLVSPKALASVPVMRHVLNQSKRGLDDILRNAPTVVLFHTKLDGMFSIVDANLAYQNASLMAESLGVSQFYLGYMCSAIRMNKGKLEAQLGIDGTIQAAMGLGMPRCEFTNYIEKPCPPFNKI